MQLPCFLRAAGNLGPLGVYAAAVLLCYPAPGSAHQNDVVYVYDAVNLPEHGIRGQTRAENDLKAGALKLYVPVCTFPGAPQTQIRQFEVRKALYGKSGITVMADLCNDIVPNGSQQAAYVAGYNSVMDSAIRSRFGQKWKLTAEKQVSIELKRKPRGTLRAADVTFETPY